jgi:hypothetical protein
MITCTSWYTTFGDPNPVVCGKEAVAKQGVRCPNGCLGEGEFDYACPEHTSWMKMGESGEIPFECMKCKNADLIIFPIQELV